MSEQLPHTPHIEEVCSAYVQYHHFNSYGSDDSEETEKSFYRMIAQIESAAEQRGAARGWDEGWNAGYFDYVEMIGNDDYQPQNNPYRVNQIEQENNDA